MNVQVAGVKWAPCFGEALQRCIGAALGSGEVAELAETLTRCRRVVEYFRRSRLAEGRLEEAQRELGLPVNRLKPDCPTRWNSTVKYTDIS